MNLDLSTEDARFLSAQIAARISHLENELVHTDKRSFKHELTLDVDRLKAIHGRVRELTQD